jgi:hypothetical protein
MVAQVPWREVNFAADTNKRIVVSSRIGQRPFHLSALAIYWPRAFMNMAALLTFMVAKSAQGCWPLIVSSANGPCAVLRPASAPITVAKSPEALAKLWLRAPPTILWLGVMPLNEVSARVRNTSLASRPAPAPCRPGSTPCPARG